MRTFTSLVALAGLLACGDDSDARSSGSGNGSTETTDTNPGSVSESGPTPESGSTLASESKSTGEEQVGWRSVALGSHHACGIRTDRSLWCWGSNGNLQLGTPELGLAGRVPIPTRVGSRTDWEDTWAGSQYTFARTPGELWSWGINADGQLANGNVSPREPGPVQPLVPADLAALGLTIGYACARFDDGGLRCWGNGEQGQTGIGIVDASGTPSSVDLPAPIIDHGVGRNHSCALTEDSALWCWGAGGYGQLGTSALDDAFTPVAAFVGVDVAAIALVISDRTCVRDRAGTTHCAGRNTYGEFGDGQVDEEPVIEPRAVPALDGLRLGGGLFHTCGLDGEGILFCWGGNAQGQLGDGTTEDRTQPVQITDSHWTSVTTT